jgi:transposase-like protein
MTDADAPIHRALARQEASEQARQLAGQAAAERATPNAALCGAQPFSAGDAPAGEVVAGEGVEANVEPPLSARQSRVAQMLASGMSVREVAAVLDLHRGTIFRWRQSCPAFRREQRRCAAEAAGELSSTARRLLVKATGYIDRLMEEDCSRDEWAARILRNPRLWDLALSGREESDV